MLSDIEQRILNKERVEPLEWGHHRPKCYFNCSALFLSCVDPPGFPSHLKLSSACVFHPPTSLSFYKLFTDKSILLQFFTKTSAPSFWFNWFCWDRQFWLILAYTYPISPATVVAFLHLSPFVPQGFCDREAYNAPIPNCPSIAYMLIIYLFILWSLISSPFGLMTHSLSICDS